MKSILLHLALLLLISVNANAQKFGFSKEAGGSSLDKPSAIATDNDGNIYVTGYFTGSATFDTVTLITSGPSNGGMFLAKYNPIGKLIWAKTTGVISSNFNSGNGICVDTHGYIYVTGAYNGSIRFDSIMLTSNPYAGFLTKYNSDGKVIWAKSIGNGTQGESLFADSKGGIYVTGEFQNKQIFGKDTINSGSSLDIYVAKCDTAGNWMWANCITQGNQTGRDFARGVCADSYGNAYLTGELYIGSAAYNPFIAKYNPLSRVWEWIIQPNSDARGISICCDKSNNICACGFFYSSKIVFGNTTITNPNTNATQMFLVKYDASGNNIWAKTFLCNNWNGLFAAKVDRGNNLVISGEYGGSPLIIGKDTLGIDPNSIYNTYSFVAKLDSSGFPIWATKAAGHSTEALAIDLCPDGNPVIAGWFAVQPPQNIPEFVGDSLFNGYGNNDIYILKLKDTTLTSIINPEASFHSNASSICANDCINFTNLSSNATSYKWIFQGALTATDTSANPKNICYSNGGAYDVTLIAKNAGGSDTLVLSNYIKVYPAPPTPSITISHDTLFCHADSAYASYQWYLDSNIIAGKTDTLLIITQNGNYNLKITDKNGCITGVGINTTVGLQDFATNSLYVSPNPAREQLTIHSSFIRKDAWVNVTVINLLGEIVQEEEAQWSTAKTIDVSNLPAGIYFVQVSDSKDRWTGRFVKD